MASGTSTLETLFQGGMDGGEGGGVHNTPKKPPVPKEKNKKNKSVQLTPPKLYF